jgi:hypothetical protein
MDNSCIRKHLRVAEAAPIRAMPAKPRIKFKISLSSAAILHIDSVFTFITENAILDSKSRREENGLELPTG